MRGSYITVVASTTFIASLIARMVCAVINEVIMQIQEYISSSHTDMLC